MKAIFQLWLLSILLWGLNACKTPNLLNMKKKEVVESNIDSLFNLRPDYQYTIRKDDKLTISVWGQDDLSVGSTYGIYNSNEVYGKWLMVDADGRIEIPRLGAFQVEGKTIVQLKLELRAILKEWLVNPVIEIKVLNKEISLLGEFRNPQVVGVDKENNYLMALISEAGGFDKYADLKRVKILRKVGDQNQLFTVDLSKKGDLRFQNLPLYPGDVIIAPSKKYKTFDQRISVILPFTSAMTATAILYGILK